MEFSPQPYDGGFQPARIEPINVVANDVDMRQTLPSAPGGWKVQPLLSFENQTERQTLHSAHGGELMFGWTRSPRNRCSPIVDRPAQDLVSHVSVAFSLSINTNRTFSKPSLPPY